MVSVMSLLNMRKPKGGLLWRENKAPCPLPILLITVLLPIYWCFILNSGILPSHSFLFASLARKNPLSFLWVPSHSVSHKNWNILLGWAVHFLLSPVPHRLPCRTGYMKWLRFNSSEESVLDYRFPPHLTPPPFFFPFQSSSFVGFLTAFASFWFLPRSCRRLWRWCHIVLFLYNASTVLLYVVSVWGDSFS